MKKKSASQSAFFKQGVLIPVVLLSGGVLLAMFAMSAQVKRGPSFGRLADGRAGIGSSAAQAGATPTPCAIFAYISNAGDIPGDLSVIDTSSNAVVATVSVGSVPYGVAVNPAGTRVYVTNEFSETVSVIDTSTNTVVAIAVVGQYPKGVAVTPDGTRVYVANYGQGDSTVSVIDTSTNTVVATIAGFFYPYGLAVKPDGTRVYVANSGLPQVLVIDTSTNTIVATVPVAGYPQGVAVNPAGTFAYVTTEFGDHVSVIDTSNNTVVATVSVGSQPTGVAVNPAGTRAYVTNVESNTVSVIDTSNNTVVATVPVGSGPTGVSVTPDGTLAYVANSLFFSNTVSVIDTSNNTVVATVPVGTTPEAFGNFIAAVPCPSPTPTPTPTPPPTPSPTPVPCPPFRVLIVYADTPPPIQLQSEIQAQPNVAVVDLFDGQTGTPTLAQLQQYDIVVPFSNFPFLDATVLGDNLADYVDGGGIVVQYGFSHYGPDLPYGVNGRWLTNNYNPYSYTHLLGATVFTLGSFNAGHPLMAGVTTLNSNYQNIVGPAAGATQVAAASNLYSLIAYRPTSGGHTTVGVTAYVGDGAFQSGDWGKVIVNAANWLHNCQVGGTPTPTPSPTCTVGPWQLVASMPIDLLGPTGASDGRYFYSAGGYSFVNGGTQAVVNRYDPVADTWMPMAAMPQPAAVATAVYYPPTNKIYVFGGGNPDTLENYNTTRIYDIVSNSWSTGAPMPDVRDLAAGGYIPATGQIYIISGDSTGLIESAQPNTWAYDPVANRWTDLTGSAPFPHPAGGFAYGVVNNKLYIAGGRDATNTVINLTWGYDPVANTYTQKADEPDSFQNNVPGSAVASGLLWVFGGGNPFNGADASYPALPSMALPNATKAAPPKALVAGVNGGALPTTESSGRYYDPASDTWTSSPNLLAARSFPAGGAIDDSLLIAAGGFNGSASVATVQKETVCIGTPSPAPTATATATTTASPPPSPTPTPTATPRPSPTPRSEPTPRSRPTPPPRPMFR